MIRKHFMAAAVVIAAFLLRVTQLPIDHIPAGDNLNYWIIADELLRGRGLLFPDPNLGFQRAFFPPLYPLLLAGTLLNPVAIVALNYAFDLAASAAILWIGRLTGNERPSKFASAIYLFWPTNVLLDPYPQKEGLVAALCLLCAGMILSRRWLLLGAAWGLLMLTQPGLAPLPALFVAFAVPRSQWLAMAKAALLAVAVLLPWWIRNWIVFDTFVPLTTSSGFSLWIGLLPGHSGSWVEPPARFAIGELAGNRAAAVEAVRFLLADPSGELTHCAQKVVHAFGDNTWPFRAFRISAHRPTFLIIFAAGATAILNWVAVASLLAMRGKLGRLLVAGAIQIVVVQSWFELDERHRYFLTPFLLLGAAVAIMPILHRPKFHQTQEASGLNCT